MVMSAALRRLARAFVLGTDQIQRVRPNVLHHGYAAIPAIPSVVRRRTKAMTVHGTMIRMSLPVLLNTATIICNLDNRLLCTESRCQLRLTSALFSSVILLEPGRR
jgi:hypothetical protein